MARTVTDKRMVGLEVIQYGDVSLSKQMTTTLNSLYGVVRDSGLVTFEEGVITDIFISESDSPYLRLKTAGIRTITFGLYDTGPDVLAFAFEGTFTPTKYTPPRQEMTSREIALKVTTKGVEGFKQEWSIPRASLQASFEGKLYESELGQINVNVGILSPITSTAVVIAPYEVDYVAV